MDNNQTVKTDEYEEERSFPDLLADAIINASAYGKLGLSLFVLMFGLVHSFPNYFPDGVLFVACGFLILSVNILNYLINNTQLNYFQLFIAVIFSVKGVADMFNYELMIFPTLILVLGVFLTLIAVRNILKNTSSK